MSLNAESSMPFLLYLTSSPHADLIKYDTPLNSAKISKMLNQLEFKLRVEKEYMQGIEKMAKLYQVRLLLFILEAVCCCVPQEADCVPF